MYSELSYTRRGSGEPLVLIHGIGHRRQAWDPVVSLLADSYEVFAVDLAGFGTSAPPPDRVGYSMENACQNLADNFSLWGIENPTSSATPWVAPWPSSWRPEATLDPPPRSAPLVSSADRTD